MTTATATKQADHYIVTPKPDGYIMSEFEDGSDALEYAVHVGGQAWVVFTDGSELAIA